MTRPATVSFGVMLGRLLAERGLTQSELARSLDVAPATVARWMGNSRTPTASTVTRIASQLGLAEDEPQRVAERQHPLAHADLLGVAEHHRRAAAFLFELLRRDRLAQAHFRFAAQKLRGGSLSAATRWPRTAPSAASGAE